MEGDSMGDRKRGPVTSKEIQENLIKLLEEMSDQRKTLAGISDSRELGPEALAGFEKQITSYAKKSMAELLLKWRANILLSDNNK